MNGESILNFKQKALPVSINKTGWTLFLLGLLLSVIAFIFDPQRGAFNLLIIFMFIYSQLKNIKERKKKVRKEFL